ncbi:MAG: dephospho-CoA kinase [Oscillospiraceae bacterium]
MSYIVGLTGQTGSGKTTASQMLKEAGFGIINCDLVSREVTKKGSECLKQIVINFGECILTENKELDRKKLGKIVFSDKQKLSELNDIIFPYITNSILERINEESSNFDIIVLDAPTLFESNANKFCNSIIAVVADEEKIIVRIVKRDNLSPELAKDRVHAQHTKEFFTNNCSFVVENNSDTVKLKKTILKIIDVIKENANEK